MTKTLDKTEENFIISDINWDEIGKRVMNEKWEIIKETFSVRVKRIDGIIINPKMKKGYLEFIDTDEALKFSPEPDKNIVKKETSKKSKLLTLLEKAKKEIPDTNPFKIKLQGLINEVISKI